MSFGRVILGDNQFLGINHASPAKAAQLQDRFASTDAILEVIGFAHGAGIRDFMFTTHERLGPAIDEIVRSRLFPGMQFIPCLPYAHKYANTLGEGGFMAVIKQHLVGCSMGQLLGGAARVAVGDFAAVMQLLLEVELLMTKGLNVRGVFLQNIVFDLLMGLRGQKLIERFHRTVEGRFQATPGYITMNHPMAQRMLCDEIGLPTPWLCANFNSAGFRMNPSPAEVQASFGNGRSRNMAMSVLASGALPAQQSVAYVAAFKGVDSVLFGSSRQANIEANVKLIHQHSPTAAAALASLSS